VEEAIAALQPGMKGIEFDTTLFRPATYIETAAANIGNALVVGAILVVLTLFAFLWNWRVALISAAAILLSTLASVLVLYQRGATFNAMVLAGLVVALGVIIETPSSMSIHRVATARRRTASGSPMLLIRFENHSEAASEMRGTSSCDVDRVPGRTAGLLPGRVVRAPNNSCTSYVCGVWSRWWSFASHPPWP
jgi:Cu/Ag efflux pump CusA